MKEQDAIEVYEDDQFAFEDTDSNSGSEASTRVSPTRMSQILRALGALIIVASASTFLFQRWGGGSDMSRYFMLLAFTGALSIGGFFCAVKLKESKGARTLLGLTLGVAPVNFAVIAGLVYSQFSWDGPLVDVPVYASWVAPNANMALVAACAGVAVLAPLGYLSFLALSRDRAKALAVSFVVGNALLMVPTRHPDAIGFMFVALAAVLCGVEIKALRNASGMTTFEGYVSRILLWVPPAILVGRSFHLYSPSSTFIGCILAVVGAAGFIFAPSLIKQEKSKKTVQALSMIPATISWLNFNYVIQSTYKLPGAALVPLVLLPIAVILMFASVWAVGGGTAYRRLASTIALLTASANLVMFPGVASALLCIGVAVAIMIYGFIVEQKIVFAVGVLGVLFGLGHQVKYAISAYSFAGWGVLACIGVAIIIAASVLEKNQGQLKERVDALRGRFQGWKY